MSRTLLAGLLQVAGLVTVSVAIGLLAVWGGVLTLGVGLVLLGIALERGSADPS